MTSSDNIQNWSDIKKNYNEAILLGNGASIAMSQSFDYKSLKKVAFNGEENNENLKEIFESFDTDDFELILW